MTSLSKISVPGSKKINKSPKFQLSDSTYNFSLCDKLSCIKLGLKENW